VTRSSVLARLLLPLVAVNLLVWVSALAAFGGNSVLLGAALLAYMLGLRHAVDADHIAAIDNVTRKLIQTGERPLTTGLCFSLGHSAVVWLASIGVAFAAATDGRLAGLQAFGSLFGTGISTLFLLVIAAANVAVLRGILHAIRRHRRGESPAQDAPIVLGGLYAGLFRPLFRLVSKSWHMLAIGFLFGLGFDTASEIGLLGLSAAGSGNGLPVWSILFFPALFTAGMSLVDTLDSVLMTQAYGWAFVQPGRKLYYNLAVTFLSVLVALVVGGMQGLDLIGAWLRHGVWPNAVMAAISGGTGYAAIAAFAGLWLGAVMLHRRRAWLRAG
jgi:high-affinity nickel-transport protein